MLAADSAARGQEERFWMAVLLYEHSTQGGISA